MERVTSHPSAVGVTVAIGIDRTSPGGPLTWTMTGRPRGGASGVPRDARAMKTSAPLALVLGTITSPTSGVCISVRVGQTRAVSRESRRRRDDDAKEDAGGRETNASYARGVSSRRVTTMVV